MRNAKMLIAFALVLLTPACSSVEWLNPCYKEEDLVLDPALAGTWKGEDSTSVLKFRETGDKSYEMLFVESPADNAEPELEKFSAHLVRLGNFLFLDLVPEIAEVRPGAYKLTIAPRAAMTAPQPPLTNVGDRLYAVLLPNQEGSGAGREGGYCELHLVQTHWVLQVQLDRTGLRFIDLDEEWFKEAANQGRIHVGFERIDDTFVLTGSPEELRQFLLEIAGDEHAFPKDSGEELSRQK